MIIRQMLPDELDTVSSLIFHSTNEWYLRNLNRSCFPGEDSTICRIFPEVYESLDPGCCLVAEVNGTIVGSCFYRIRETHVSLGIMNASADFSGKGAASALLCEIIQRADSKPIRLVSSAQNLDSYSLYTKAGFTPFALYQDMFFPPGSEKPPTSQNTRPAELSDLPAIVDLEEELNGIRREKDFRHFITNEAKIWSGSVYEANGQITGFLFSVNHSGSQLLGPGCMHDTESALSLIGSELRRFEQSSPIFLIPAQEKSLVHQLYQLGARNCELHVAQVRGEAMSPKGIIMPTFMPESG